MKAFISIILLVVGSAVYAQPINGSSYADFNTTHQYSFTNGYIIMGANWEVIGGAEIVSTSQSGTIHYVNIKWTSVGLKTINFKNGIGVLSSKTVNVTGSPALGYDFGGFIGGTSVVEKDDNTVSLEVNGHLGTITQWQMSYDPNFSQIDASFNGSSSSFTYNDLDKTAYFRVVTTYDSDTFYSNVQSVLVLEVPAGDGYTGKLIQYTALEEVASGATLTENNAVRSTQYADGFGRPVQNRVYDHVRDESIVSFANYDSLGRTTRNYLPYSSTLDDFEVAPTSAQKTYYQNPGSGMESSSYPYAEVVYDDRYQRVIEQGAPGADWQIGSGHTVSYDYDFNVANEVRKWDFEGTAAGTYPAGELRKVQMTDENNHKVITYTNDLGQTILKKVEQSTGVYLFTYSVYDIFGRLIHTIPPKAWEEMASAGQYSITQNAVKDLVYTYTYDSRGRLIERNIPGKGIEYLVYDQMDRVVLTQDANLRSNNQWLFMKYDLLGRVVVTGLITETTDIDTLRTEAQNSSVLYESFDPSGPMQYTNIAYPTTNGNTDFLSANYYDSYDYQLSWTEDLSFDKPGDDTSTESNNVITEDHTVTQAEASAQLMYLEGVVITIPPNITLMNGFELISISQDALDNAGIKQAPSTRLLATGSITKAENQWLKAAVYYDEDQRLAQSQQTNHLGGKDVSTMYYESWTNRVFKTIQSHTDGSDLITITQRYTYDALGRLMETTHQINDETPQVLNQPTYNEMGQLIEKNIGNNLQSIDYTYNIRGWLTSINDPSLGSEDDLFGMTLAYNTAESGLGNTAQYNGNISGTKWSSYDTEDSGITERGYAYSYDAADRMLSANHKNKNVSWTNPTTFDMSGGYDANGNIETINRDGTDALTYTYTNNQLMRVSDAAGATGFTDGNTSGDDYAYDSNGNMTKDLNKGIDQIRYNYLDKPVSIVLSNDEADSLTYTYSAAGSKLSMQVWKDNAVQSSVDYIGSFRYEDGVLRSFAHSEGRVVLQEVNNETKYDYQYHLTDHQGNTRRVLSTLHQEYTSTENFEGADNGFTDLHPITNTNANTTAGGNKVERLQSGQTGALVLLRIDKRDTINLQVQANYESAPSGNSFASITANALFNSWDNAFGNGVEGGIGNNIEGQFQDALNNGMGGKNSGNTAPRAFLNYIIFDLEMNHLTSGFQQISTAASGVGVHEQVEINDIIVEQSGYLLTYLSNENQQAVNIHFDDFEVKHSKTNVVQAVDYYPFGMEATSYTRTSADPTKYLYNGGVERNDLTSYYETFYRQYDASIGRFTGVDIAASSFSGLTPYQYAFNDPVTYNDPLGDFPREGSLFDEIQKRNRDSTCDACDGGSTGGIGLSSVGWGNGLSGGYRSSNGYAYEQYKQNVYNAQLKWRAKQGNVNAVNEYVARHGESDNSAAIDALSATYEWIEVWMQQVWSDGSATQIAGQGNVHVYTDPKIIAGVLDYYLNKLPTLQELAQNGGGDGSDYYSSGLVTGLNVANIVRGNFEFGGAVAYQELTKGGSAVRLADKAKYTGLVKYGKVVGRAGYGLTAGVAIYEVATGTDNTHTWVDVGVTALGVGAVAVFGTVAAPVVVVGAIGYGIWSIAGGSDWIDSNWGYRPVNKGPK